MAVFKNKEIILAALKGDKGDKGEKGDTGATGAQGASVWKVSNYSISDDGTLVGTITPESGVTIKPLVGDLAIITAAASNGSSEYIGWLCKITLVASGTLVTLEPIVSLKGDGAGDFATEEDIKSLFISLIESIQATYIFNKTIDMTDINSLYRVSFTCNGEQYNYLQVNHNTGKITYGSSLIVYENNVWTDEKYRTITVTGFSGESSISLIQFFQNNSIKATEGKSISLGNLKDFKEKHDEQYLTNNEIDLISNDELIGTWVFNNKTITKPSGVSSQTFSVEFICDNVKYDKIKVEYSQFSSGSISGNNKIRYYYGSQIYLQSYLEGWKDEKYKTINITNTSNLSNRSTFINFLNNNGAVKIDNTNFSYKNIPASVANLLTLKEEVETLKNSGGDSGGVASSSKKHLNLELSSLYLDSPYSGEPKKALNETQFFADTGNCDGLEFNFVWNGNARIRDCKRKKSPRLKNNRSHVNEKVDFRKSNINFLLNYNRDTSLTVDYGLTIYDVLRFIFATNNSWLDNQFSAGSNEPNRTDVCVHSKRDQLYWNADNTMAIMPIYYFDMGDLTVEDIRNLFFDSFGTLGENIGYSPIRIDNTDYFGVNNTRVIDTGSGYSNELIINLKPVINYSLNDNSNGSYGWSGDMNSSSMELRIQFTSNNIGQQEGNIAMIMYIGIEKVD